MDIIHKFITTHNHNEFVLFVLFGIEPTQPKTDDQKVKNSPRKKTYI